MSKEVQYAVKAANDVIEIIDKNIPVWKNPVLWWIGAAAVVLLAVVVSVLIIYKLKKGKKPEERQNRRTAEETIPAMEPLKIVYGPAKKPAAFRGSVGKVHNIGNRQSQQDSLGVVNTSKGVFAVVADGMGGLADGDKVSQKIVLTMLQDASQLTEDQAEGKELYPMLSHANDEVNRMLGVSSQYRSGSTVVAVLAEGSHFQWIAVGDSRIYLFRGSRLLQINSEHIYERELLLKAVNHQMHFDEIASDKQRGSITSFVGMGELKHMEGSLRPAELQSGDRILLMSDGVFNTLSEQEIEKILSENQDVNKAAEILEERVLAQQNPRQDNFTAVILDF